MPSRCRPGVGPARVGYKNRVSTVTRAVEEVVDKAEQVAEGAVETAHQEADAYRGSEPRPLGSLLGVIGIYLAVVGVAGAVATRLRRWPARIDPLDIALATVATHRAAMLVSKDTVAAPLRAPFTRFEGPAGEGKLNESVRGTGVRKAVGELITCPFCLGHWFATFWAIGLVFAPRQTRVVSALFAAGAGANWLHRLEGKLQD